MLPPARMLAIKKLLSRRPLPGAACGLALLLASCTPPGPRALIKGDRLVQEGKYRAAVQTLEAAQKLLEREPRFWNCLGLAYHGAGDATRAAEAYRRALSLDRSNLVFVAHYNLGCLLLEQGNASAAAEKLRSFCMLSNSLPALLKLGQAELRTRQWDGAERAFAAAQRIRPDEPAAFNGLGLVQLQRNRFREAAALFQSALRSDPKYAPALLNLAVAYHQQPSQKGVALQKYREYLALEPRPANYEVILATVRRLEQELAPPPVLPTTTNTVALVPARTNVVAPLPLTHSTQRVAVATASNVVKQASNILATATNVVRPPTNVARVAVAPPPARTNWVVPTNVARATVLSPPARTNWVAPTNTLTSAPPAVTVVTVTLSNAAPVPRAQDLPPKPAPVTASPTSPATGSLWVVKAEPAKPEKRGFLQSLNPFRSRPRATPATNAMAAPGTKVIALPIAAPIAPIAPAANTVRPISPAPVASPPPVFPRYVYLAPARPVAGERAAAAPLFGEGFRAQQEGRTDVATRAYRAALEKDPAYYEAYYNLGLLAFQVGDWKAALHAYETALALRPEATPARLNLGLALDRANYPLDAAEELEKVIQAESGEARAHLTLGNLCAQKLGQPARAREHYLKVLELDPRHPQSNAIRYWLAAHP